MHTLKDLETTLQKQTDELLLYSCDEKGFALFWEKFVGWCKKLGLESEIVFEKDNTCVLEISGKPFCSFRFYKYSLYSFVESFNEKLGKLFSKDHKKAGLPYDEAKAMRDRMYKLLDLYKKVRDYYYNEDDNGG